MSTRCPLLLNGFMGTGKSTVGRRVAQMANVPFVDLDIAIAAKEKRSIPEIFAAEGEMGFRRREAEALREVVASADCSVVAVGGGALLQAPARRSLLLKARIVTLTAAASTVLERTRGDQRPLLGPAEGRLARIEAFLEARAEAYAECHTQIPTDGRAVDEVARDVYAAWTQRCIAVPLGSRTYTVSFVCRQLEAVGAAVKKLRPSAVFVVTDENVARLWGGALASALSAEGVAPKATIVLVPGEPTKQLAAVEKALTTMVSAGADRDAVVIGHGGGVVTDIAGFAAATLLRGVRWVAVPTTLLSMVDASVGGKTGVDLGLAKNAVGAFHQPRAVIIDTAHVTTELDRAYRSGLAEVVKSAAIGDAALFDRLEKEADRVLARDPEAVDAITFDSVAVKAAVVARDERESGDRALLNFGHTIGHALEAHGGFERLTHGEAVSLGMVAALRVGEALQATPKDLARRVTSLLDRLGLPTGITFRSSSSTPSRPHVLEDALRFVALDKKRQSSKVRFVLLHAIADARVRPIEMSELPGLLAD